MPTGTTIGFSAVFGVTTAKVSPSQEIVPDYHFMFNESAAAGFYRVTVECPAGTTTGKLKVVVTTPSGVKSSGEVQIN
jgi:type IV secretory pathway protease TraF